VTRRARLIAIGLVILTSGVTIAHAQTRRPQAGIAPIVERDAVHAGTDVRVALQVRLPEGLHMQSDKPRDPALIPTVLSIDAPAGVTVSEIVYPPSTDLKQAGQDQPLAVFEREFVIGIRLTLAPDVAVGDLVVPARMRYQACDATMCYLPQRAETRWTLHVVPAGTATPTSPSDVFAQIAFGRGEQPALAPGNVRDSIRNPQSAIQNVEAALDTFTVLGTTVGYQGSADFLRFIHDAENGVKPRGMFEGHGALAILLIVLLGGLALNLTPCVLPMIPINLAIIGAGAQAGSRSRGFLLGAAYGAAMAIVYGVLGVVVILTAGTFGTINASPWFNAGIAVLFVVLALAMFDVITIDFSSLAGGFRTSEAARGTFLLAFGMGGVAALLAGACVAPVVIEVVLFSSNLYAKGTAIALALPFVLGVGMGVPWPIAGAGLASLPKPGAWMVRVKQAFGVLILATAVYYGYESYLLFANRSVDPGAVASSVQEKLKAGWHASLAEGLDVARGEHKRVLIDLWATWCKNCLTMDKTTLEDPRVTAALAGYVKIKFQAEDPDEPTVKAVMKRFSAVGLPTYVILR
jgi:thioredoxin:protein disulfide reductase